jgi:two-component system chemotaxis response regulator CheY
MRRDSAYDAARVMLVTSESQVDQVLSAIQAGANEYIMKPFTAESLLEKLTILGFNVETEAGQI